MTINNFGHNISFKPRNFYQPRTENEVLDILNRHARGKIRVQGSLHAWSDAVVCDDVFLDIRYLDQMELTKDADGAVWATAAGGCVLKRLVEKLASENVMIPAMGGIMKQTIAGLISTGTHGTGGSSLSHFMEEVRIAGYDPQTGMAKIFTFAGGDGLRAARCAVGCMGVVVSVKFKCVSRYWVLETIRHCKTIDDVLAQEQTYPIQQTAVFPYLWEYFVFSRKKVEEPGGSKKMFSSFMRIVDYLSVEMLPHIFIKLLLLIKNNKNIVVRYYKKFLPVFMGNEFTVVNEDYLGLTLHTLHHWTFRHVEMEVFIPESKIRQAMPVIASLTDFFAGVKNSIPENLKQQLSPEITDEVTKFQGKHVHHYPIFIRKVFPDDTLISTTAGKETYYALGFFTYFKESKRQAYYHYCLLMAKILNRLFGARLHWGKYFPLAFEDIEKIYPDLQKFRDICSASDPEGVFQNNFAKRVLGFK